MIYKRADIPAKEFALEIGKWLSDRGYPSVVYESGNENLIRKEKIVFAVILGGDGTILGVARNFIGKKVPLLGINFGNVGFLATLCRHDWKNRILDYIGNEASISRHIALRWTIYRSCQKINCGNAVNDIVVSRGALARLVNIGLQINDRSMGAVRCDGVIISTPLGSTGYNISAGGPLLDSEMKALITTPICPFRKSFHPLVLPFDTSLQLTMVSESSECYLTVDGQLGQPLQYGDTVEISGVADAVFFMGRDESFCGRLKTRGFMFENTGNRTGKRVENESI